MTNIAAKSRMVASNKAHAEEECRYYSWLEDYLERLEGKEAYREFQERHYGSHKYYALIASLAA